MRNTTLSRLALLGLATVSSLAFAANTVNGEIRFDARFTSSQKNSANDSVGSANETPDNLYVSRARLDMQGDVAKNWTYGIRLEVGEFENSQLNLDPSGLPVDGETSVSGMPFMSYASLANDVSAKFARAYVTWSGIENINISFGRIGCPDISSDRIYYMPYIGSYPNNGAVGTVVGYSGDHAGFAIDGKAGPVGYSFGVWKQTDLREIESLPSVAQNDNGSGDFLSTVLGFEASTNGAQIAAANYDSKSLRLGFGGRLTFAHKMNASTSYGVGVGYNQAPLNAPVALITYGDYYTSSNGTSNLPTYSISSFNRLDNFAVDGSAVFGAFQVNVGYQIQKLHNDDNVLLNSDTSSAVNAAAQVFNNDGKANAWWIEGGYLIMGDSYKFDAAKAVVSGVKLRENQAGLELVVRYGQEVRKNVLALLNTVGYNDFSATSDDVQSQTTMLQSYALNSAYNKDAVEIFVDNKSANPGGNGTTLVVSDETAYESKVSGYAIGLNYYLTENAVVKAEFEQRSYDFQRMSSNSSYQDSLNNRTLSTIRLRADYSF